MRPLGSSSSWGVCALAETCLQVVLDRLKLGQIDNCRQQRPDPATSQKNSEDKPEIHSASPFRAHTSNTKLHVGVLTNDLRLSHCGDMSFGGEPSSRPWTETADLSARATASRQSSKD